MSGSRIANLGVLFTAMLAVVVTGDIPPLPSKPKEVDRTARVAPSPESIELGQRIKHLRKQKLGLTMREFASLIGSCQPSVSQWEHAQVNISPIALMAIGRLDTENKAWWFERAKQKPADCVDQALREAAEVAS